MSDLRAVAALPDALVRTDAVPGGRRPRLVATGYGGSVRSSFSGSSAFLAEAGIAAGTLDGCFTLYNSSAPDRGLQALGAAWKMRQLLRRESASGFKFSPEFSAYVWRRHLAAVAGTDVISNFQLFSRRFFERRASYDVRCAFYLDGTLHDYLVGYREYDTAGIDPRTAERVMAVEREGYHAAEAVAVMSEFTASTLVKEYGLPRERIAVVLPGANLPDEMAERVHARRAERLPSDDVVVGFVGVYPERKGLPALAQAVSLLRREGLPVRLVVVGSCPDDIALLDGVEALGYVSKTREPDRFVEALAQIDIGCQLSRAELFGIAVLEFLRCGIPVLATEVGGVTDVLGLGGGTGISGDYTVDEVAEALRRFVVDEELRRRLTHEARQRAPHVRWEGAAAELARLVSGPSDS